MPTIQQQLNQLKKDKETLNTMLNTMGVETKGDETFTQLAPLVGKIVADPILQNKSVEITENGTTNVTADEGYDGLNSVEVITNVGGSGDKIAPMGLNFNGYKGTEIKGLDVVDTSNLVSGNQMFYNCSNLTKLNLNNWSVSNMKNFQYMFRECTSLTELHIENWITSSVTNMDSLLFNCKNLKSIDLNKWDVNKATNLCRIFYGCSSLTTLDLSNWVTTSATDMVGTFDYCTSLQRLDIRNFVFNSSANINEMFRYTKADCLIIVKDDDTKALITSKFARLTNVKTVAELG